jgi:iron complex transport system substrate-binding protein
MKRLLLLVIPLTLFLSACAASQDDLDSALTPIIITDALDRQVILPGAPQRIVITGKALIMIADAAYIFPEAPDRIVGMGDTGQGAHTFIDLVDPEYSNKYVLEGDAGAEQIAALKPDLVILKSYLAETVGEPIEEIGIPVVYVDFETPEQYTRDLAIFGQVFQNPKRANEITAFYQDKTERIRQTISEVESRPVILMLYYNDKDGNLAFNVPPAAWMQTRMVEMAGGDPIWTEANLGGSWTQVSLEQIAAWDADQIFIISYRQNPAEIVVALKADPTWQALRASQNDQLHAFPGDLYSWDQPDPRWILGLTWLAGQLHPEFFPNLEITAEAREFYQTLYGLDTVFFDTNILPTFTGVLP